jgi:hypothetical protein
MSDRMKHLPGLAPSDDDLAPGLERFKKAFEPEAGDITFLVLKSHLLLEELLRDFLSKQLRHPEAIKGARLSFNQILKLSQALASTLEPNDWRWAALIDMNRLRNALAHEFESEAINTLVERIVKTVGSEVGGKFLRIDQMPRHPETGEINSQAFGLAAIGLYSVLAVRLGFDLNMRFVADRERSEQVLAAFRKNNVA